MSALVCSHVSKPSSLPRTHGAEAREGQKGQRVLSRTQPPRSTTSETTFIVRTLAKYSNVKSYRQGFHKNYKKRALLKSIFVIPIRVSFFQILQHKTLLKMKKYFATRFNGEGSPWPGRNCRSYDISCKYLNPHIVFVFCVCRLIGRIV